MDPLLIHFNTSSIQDQCSLHSDSIYTADTLTKTILIATSFAIFFIYIASQNHQSENVKLINKISAQLNRINEMTKDGDEITNNLALQLHIIAREKFQDLFPERE